MTVIGIHVCSVDRAIAWADTLTFIDQVPARHMPKLTVNATALMVGLGTGWCSLIQRAADAVHRAMSIDALVDVLPGILRRESAALAGRRIDPETFLGNGYAVVGLSQRWDRMMGFAFEARTFFEPMTADTFSSPHVGELLGMGAQGLNDVTGTALQQLADLKRPAAGAVVGATLTRDGITTRTLLTLPLLKDLS